MSHLRGLCVPPLKNEEVGPDDLKSLVEFRRFHANLFPYLNQSSASSKQHFYPMRRSPFHFTSDSFLFDSIFHQLLSSNLVYLFYSGGYFPLFLQLSPHLASFLLLIQSLFMPFLKQCFYRAIPWVNIYNAFIVSVNCHQIDLIDKGSVYLSLTRDMGAYFKELSASAKFLFKCFVLKWTFQFTS